MTLGERVQTILKECNVKQIDFAKTLGISANYVSLIISDKRGPISDTLAKLIEETYGYSSEWVINEIGDKKVSNNNLIAVRSEIIKKINKMSDDDIKAVLAYARTLENVRAEFPNELVTL